MTTEKASRYIKLRPVQPDQPTNVSPADGGNGAVTPTLTSSAFSSNEVEGEIHINSIWRVATDANMTSIIYDSGLVVDLVEHTVPVSAGLAGLTEYHFDVVHIGARGGASKNSISTSFTTLVLLSDAVSLTAYTGNAPSDQSIVNGLNMLASGALSVGCVLDNATKPLLSMPEVGIQKFKQLGVTDNVFQSDVESILSFDVDGYTVGTTAAYNSVGVDRTEMSILKGIGVCDVVPFTGDGLTTQTIPHSLGQEVGMIWLLSVSAKNWVTWMDGNTVDQVWQDSGLLTAGSLVLGGVLPTSTEFTVGLDLTFSRNYNQNAQDFIAVIFPKNSPIGIGTGTYVGTGIAGQKIVTGVDTGWIFIRPHTVKPATIHNKIGGITGSKKIDVSSATASTMLDSFDIDGFTLSADPFVNTNGVMYDYFYMADPNG